MGRSDDIEREIDRYKSGDFTSTASAVSRLITNTGLGLPDIKRGDERREAFAAKAKDQTKNRKREWKRWREERDRLIESNPHLADNMTEIARHIKKNLELSETIRAICRRI